MDPLAGIWSSPLAGIWSSQFELDDIAFIHHFQKSSIDQQRNCTPFPNPDISISVASQIAGTIVTPPSTLTFYNSPQQAILEMPSSSGPQISTEFISFRNLNSTNSSSYQQYGVPKVTVKTEPEMNKMICFQSMEFSTTSSSSSLEALQCHQLGLLSNCQPVRRTRTPLQVKSHVIAERKRREKLSQRFMALSTLIPGLKKLDKTSVIDGAINHLKQLEKRLKALEEGTTMRDEESVLAGEKPCLCYHYEEDSPTLKKMEVRILRGDVLIKVTCKNQTGFTEEDFANEMKKLNLSVTKRKFMPFRDNMLAVSAVAQMSEGFCMTEEELANSIRLAILRLI